MSQKSRKAKENSLEMLKIIKRVKCLPNYKICDAHVMLRLGDFSDPSTDEKGTCKQRVKETTDSRQLSVNSIIYYESQGPARFPPSLQQSLNVAL